MAPEAITKIDVFRCNTEINKLKEFINKQA